MKSIKTIETNMFDLDLLSTKFMLNKSKFYSKIRLLKNLLKPQLIKLQTGSFNESITY